MHVGRSCPAQELQPWCLQPPSTSWCLHPPSTVLTPLLQLNACVQLLCVMTVLMNASTTLHQAGCASAMNKAALWPKTSSTAHRFAGAAFRSHTLPGHRCRRAAPGPGGYKQVHSAHPTNVGAVQRLRYLVHLCGELGRRDDAQEYAGRLRSAERAQVGVPAVLSAGRALVGCCCICLLISLVSQACHMPRSVRKVWCGMDGMTLRGSCCAGAT